MRARLELVGRAEDQRVALRSAIFDGEGQRAVAALSGKPRDGLLQLAGDGLLLALAQGVEGAPDLARRCAEELRARAWEGGEVQQRLAFQDHPAPTRRSDISPMQWGGIGGDIPGFNG